MARTLGSRLVMVFSAVASFVACGGASSQDLGAPNDDTGGSSTSSSSSGSTSSGGSSSGGSSGSSSGSSSGTSSGSSSGTSSGSSSGTSSGSSSGTSSGSSSGGRDASTDAAGDAGPTCGIADAGTFPTFESGCLGDQVCAIGFHLPACCGLWEAIGINHSALNAFDKAEQTWEQGCASCTCPVSALAIAQDGKTGQKSAVSVKCVFAAGANIGKCMTLVP